MKFYTLRDAVKAAQVEAKPTETPAKKKPQPYIETFSRKERFILTVLLVLAGFILWYCTALFTFAIRYGNNNSSKEESCLVTTVWATETPISTTANVKVKYYNKNRVSPREFNARFWGAMLFFKYPELEEQAEPEWTLYRDLNEPYYKWVGGRPPRAPYCERHCYWHQCEDNNRTITNE